MQGRVTDFQEKPPRGTEHSHLVNTGIYCFDPAIFDHIADGVFIDFGKDVFPALQRADEAFYGLLMPGGHRGATRRIGVSRALPPN